MKKDLKKNIRTGIIVVLSLLVLVTVALAAGQIKRPLVAQKAVPVYKYHQQAQVDYQVFYSPNNFFTDKTVEAGRGYLTPITDYLETRLHYSFNGSGEVPAGLNGTYSVMAAVTGYTMKENDSDQSQGKVKVKVWERDTVLVPPTSFAGTNSKMVLDQTVPVDVRECKDFSDKVQDQYKSAVDSVELSISYKIAVNINAAQKNAQDQLEPLLIIPLKGNSFTVDGKTSDYNQKTITNSRMVEVPGVRTARFMYIVFTIVLAILLVLIILFTTNKKEDVFEKELDQILKKYGDRIIACDGFKVVPGTVSVALNSMDDLVKAADELGRPILCKMVGAGVCSYYVIHENISYVYTLYAAILGEKHSAKKD